MSKTTRIVLLTILGVIATSFLGFWAWLFFFSQPSYPMGNDAYLSYQKVTDGPELSFDDVTVGAYEKHYDDRYDQDSSVTYYYHYLEDVSPQKMLILNETNGWIILLMSQKQYLLYDPETVEDPFGLLSPSQARLFVYAGVETDNLPQVTLNFDDKTHLEAFWQSLLETKPVEDSLWEYGIQVEDFDVKGTLTLYLDSSKRVYLDLVLGQTASGEWVWRVRALKDEGESERWYHLPCTGAFREAIESYLALLREKKDSSSETSEGGVIPPETTPAYTTTLPTPEVSPAAE